MLERFHDYCENRHDKAAEWKKQSGGKVIGYFCTHVPEEIIHAAGALPVRITGSLDIVTEAEAYVQGNVCSFARSCLDLALKGGYDYLDGVAVPHSCDIVSKMFELWRYRVKHIPFHHFIFLPHKVQGDKAQEVFAKELQTFKGALEELVGSPITDEALSHSIDVYNENRTLLKKLYEFRGEDPPKVSGVETLEVVLSSVLMPKEQHNQWLSQEIEKLGDRTDGPSGGPRVAVLGNLQDNTNLYKIIEDAGAVIVADDLCTGSRYFWNAVERSDNGPLDDIARRYLTKIPCPRTYESDSRYDHAVNMIKDYGAQGAIIYIMRCCDTHLLQYPFLRKRIEAEDIPVLYLQGEHSLSGVAPLQTRTRAFVEMLGG